MGREGEDERWARWMQWGKPDEGSEDNEGGRKRLKDRCGHMVVRGLKEGMWE